MLVQQLVCPCNNFKNQLHGKWRQVRVEELHQNHFESEASVSTPWQHTKEEYGVNDTL